MKKLKPIIVYNSCIFGKFGIAGIVFFPFIFISLKKEELKKANLDDKYLYLLNHETIHYYQQRELLVIGFYILYVLNWLINFVRFLKHRYQNICFEREAKTNGSNLNYLETRKAHSYSKYYKSSIDIAK